MTIDDRTMTGERPSIRHTTAMKLTAIPVESPIRAWGKTARSWRDYNWGDAIPFILMHLAVFAVIWTGATWQDWVCCGVLFFVRMFGVTGVYHRYFSHRTYKTSRWFQFVLAWLAMSSSQKGVLWWAAHHRDHHKYSDTERDIHSPTLWGFWYSHVGWLFDNRDQTDYGRIKDMARYPELVVLNKVWWVPPTVLGFSVWLALGWSGLVIGFALSTVLLWHATFTINSLSHVFGNQRYATGDDSRNNFWLALLTLGEGWHNNHHYYQGSTRQGFYWWEVDVTYYVLKALSWVGLVWDIREPPARVYEANPGPQVEDREAA